MLSYPYRNPPHLSLECGDPLTGKDNMLPKTGTVFHSLKLLSYCGSGAYGDVFYCQDLSGRKLAVKIISKQKLGSHWERELRGVINYRRITEDNAGLLKIHSVGEDEETFFYTMDAADSTDSASYVPDTLAARLKKGTLPENEIFPILSELFAGIRTIHQAGLVHRDIKPENILFVKGKPKIGDIGLLVSLSETMTQAAGTLDYLPPEERSADNASENAGKLNQDNDLYAFGKVIYCVVTGQSTRQWPAIPEGLPVTPTLKFFIHLSFRLCDRFPARRLVSIEEIDRRMKEIKRKLMFGETRRDQILFLLKSAENDLRGIALSAKALFRKHWRILLLLTLAVGGSIWYSRPEPPFDITQQKSRNYFNAALNLSMQIPFQWEVMNTDMMKKRIAEIKDNNEFKDPVKSRQFAFFTEQVNRGVDCIFIDYSSSYMDNITIQAFPLPGSILLEQSDEELRFAIKQLHQGELGFHTEIYTIKHLDFNGIPCIVLDLSHNPGRSRTCNYLFAMKERCITIALTAKHSTFQKRLQEFESVLKTLTFGKKTDRM